MGSTKGDPPIPGGGEESDSPVNASGDSEVQTSRSADIKPPTLTDSGTESAESEPPIIVTGGGGNQ